MSGSSCGDRVAILARVKEALSRSSDSHVKARALTRETKPIASDSPIKNWLPSAGSTRADRIDSFKRYSDKLKTRFEVVTDIPAAVSLVHGIAREENWRRVGAHHAPIVERCVDGIGVPACWTDEEKDFDAEELEGCDAGITTCEALIAQTGSVLVTCSGNGGRALSVLPPHHIVIATADQLAFNLADGYQVLRDRYGDSLPSQITFITGPSRTGDIERILVLGAHGPRELTVILIDPGVTIPGAQSNGA